MTARLAAPRPGWAADLLDLLLPRGCVACRGWIPEGERSPLVCARCRSRLREPPWPRCPRCHYPRATGRTPTPTCRECAAWPPELTAARYAFAHEAPASDLVHALKYEGWPELAGTMGAAMTRIELPDTPAGEPRIIVPMPTTAARIRSRGYNQALLLATDLAARRSLEVVEALERAKGGASQTTLSPAARHGNVAGAFRPAATAFRRVEGAHVVLVDDVLTTGATASEAAKALAGLGARSVCAATFARAMPTAA